MIYPIMINLKINLIVITIILATLLTSLKPILLIVKVISLYKIKKQIN
jgi:hypothetical protein